MCNSTTFVIASLARSKMGEKTNATGILVLIKSPFLFLNNYIIHKNYPHPMNHYHTNYSETLYTNFLHP